MQEISVWSLIDTPRNKYQLYMFLNSPNNWLGWIYQIFMMMLIMSCILVTMFMQINVGSPTEYIVLFWLDLSCLIIFSIEFLLNLWATTVLPQYSGPSRWMLILINPLYIIDMAVIGLTIADVSMDWIYLPLAAGLRGFRMIHFLHHRYLMLRLLWKAIWSERFQLIVSIYYCIVWVFSFGFLMYFIEQPFNIQFNSVANSVWWAVVTFTTVGYGNSAPVTTAGKIVTAFAMISGVWLFGLPAGIVGASLALKCEEETSTAGTLRQNYGAAMVQAAWKVYRIRKQQERLGDSQTLVYVRMRSRDCSLQFSDQQSNAAPPLQARQYFNVNAVKFVYLLKYYYYRRKFIQSEQINDSKNFYATYMQTSWQQTNLLLLLQNAIEHLKDTTNKAGEQLSKLENRLNQPDNDDQSGIKASQFQNFQPSFTRSSTTTNDSGSSFPSHFFGNRKQDSPFVLLKQRRLPLHRLLRRQIWCWQCLYKRHQQQHRFRQRHQSYDLPVPMPLLMDPGTPTSSSHTLQAPFSPIQQSIL